MKTSELLDQIEKEIQKETDSLEKNEQLVRIADMAREYNGDDRVISSEDLLEELKNTPEKPKFFSGFAYLDKKMEGFTTGESIFVSGITKHGKTSICMELSVRFSEQNTLWLSFEERPIDLMRKFHKKTGEYPHFFTPRQNEKPDLEWLEKKIIEAKAKFETKVVFIDHIGFVADAERGKDDTEASRLERISRAIHTLAVKWDVLIFLLGHLTKVGVTQQPDIENIKGSSAMAQEADLTMLIWRKTTRADGKVIIGNETNLSLQANRRGQAGNVEFIYDKGRFLESEWSKNELALEEQWEDDD